MFGALQFFFFKSGKLQSKFLAEEMMPENVMNYVSILQNVKLQNARRIKEAAKHALKIIGVVW